MRRRVKSNKNIKAKILVSAIIVLLVAVSGISAYVFIGLPSMAMILTRSLRATAQSSPELVVARVNMPLSGSAVFKKRVFKSDSDSLFESFWHQVLDFIHVFTSDYTFNWKGDFILTYGYRKWDIPNFRVSLSTQDPLEMLKGVDVQLSVPEPSILDIKLMHLDSLIDEWKFFSFHPHDRIQLFFRNKISDFALIAVNNPSQQVFQDKYDSVIDYEVEVNPILMSDNLSDEILKGVEELFRNLIQLWPGVRMRSLKVSFQ